MIGIYVLWFEESSMAYIGQSIRITCRYMDHFRTLNSGDHYNSKLQNQFNLYGMPELYILEICAVSELDSLEASWINEFDSVTKGLNRIGAGKSSKYPELDVLKVLDMLSNTDFTYNVIGRKLGVPEALVASIKNEQSNTWVREEFPDRFKAMLKHRAKRHIYSRMTILRVFILLLRGLDIRTISKITKVKDSVIFDITNAKQYPNLAVEFPDLWEELMLNIKQGRQRFKRYRALKVFSLLYNSKLNNKSIAIKCNVTSTMVSHIKRGRRYKEFKELYPKQYAKMGINRPNY